MNIQFSVKDSVIARYSVRNYSDQQIEAEKRQALEEFIGALDNPFTRQVRFHYLDQTDTKRQQKLGTYGVIKGAKQYIGTTIKPEPLALEALGYELETVMLYLAHQGLGTCWLGGTFERAGFASAMKIGENELFPIVTPYGYSAAKKHMKEVMMRKMIKADQRKNWQDLFYRNDFQTPLTPAQAADLEFPLEMVRLGPSASNKQPWRILLTNTACQFYEYKEPGYSDRLPYDIQRIDMGIAACHFDLAAKEQGIIGHFDIDCRPDLTCPENIEYVFSWVRD
ncbi:MAG: nitroreductase family protein [Bacillota bacterium]|nr:nitroreductase family protein [Bacillota bacterium]